MRNCMSQKNNPLELYVANKFKEIGYSNARPSKNSGACGELGDIAGQDICIIECKQRSTKDITIRKDVWYKLLYENINSERIKLYILENKDKDRFAVLDLDTFFEILNQIKNYRS